MGHRLGTQGSVSCGICPQSAQSGGGDRHTSCLPSNVVGVVGVMHTKIPRAQKRVMVQRWRLVSPGKILDEGKGSPYLAG